MEQLSKAAEARWVETMGCGMAGYRHSRSLAQRCGGREDSRRNELSPGGEKYMHSDMTYHIDVH